MMIIKVAAVVVAVVVWSVGAGSYNDITTTEAIELLDKFEDEMLQVMINATDLTWKQLISADNATQDMETMLTVMEVRGKYQDKVQFYLDRAQRVQPKVRRRLKMAATGYLKREDALVLYNVLNNMSRNYDTGTVCNNMEIEICQTIPAGIVNAFADELDTEKLEDMWNTWHSSFGRGLAPDFKMSLSALNDASKSVGFDDFGEEMMKTYEGQLSKPELVTLYKEVTPLYKLLHSYVRRKLELRYPDEVIVLDKAMPVILLGDLFGRFWSSLYNDMKPYPEVEEVNITSVMQTVPGNWTWLFKWAEQRYTSMGLKPLPESFFENSKLKEEVGGGGGGTRCQPSAWDMYLEDDYRIYMCTEVTEEHLQTIVHLLGHLQYFQYFSEQPFLYRDGANEGFQEAISSLFTLVFSSPTHLYSTGFQDVTIEHKPSKEIEMNYLFHVALALLPPLPYLLALDVWRWKVYAGLYAEEEWNCEYWKLRKYYSGVLPSLYRTAEDLDMLPNFQLAHTQTATKHFTAIFMMFQILEALCKAEGHKGTLHTCDLYGKKEAGRLLARAMSLGASQSWPSTYKILTGTTQIQSGALLRYFHPLTTWLEEDGLNAGPGGVIGWGDPLEALDGGVGGGGGGAVVVVVVVLWKITAVLTLLDLAVARLLMT